MTFSPASIRCGIGYDTHRLAEGRKLALGGVVIPSRLGPISHSDGDVLSHAIADALLGAAGLGDIGQRFPDTDPLWEEASSLIFLTAIRELLATNGWGIAYVDSVIVLDAPKLAPHIASIQAGIARALGIDHSQVSIKAKTSEGVAPALAAAHAVALLTSAHPAAT